MCQMYSMYCGKVINAPEFNGVLGDIVLRSVNQISQLYIHSVSQDFVILVHIFQSMEFSFLMQTNNMSCIKTISRCIFEQPRVLAMYKVLCYSIQLLIITFLIIAVECLYKGTEIRL